MDIDETYLEAITRALGHIISGEWDMIYESCARELPDVKSTIYNTEAATVTVTFTNGHGYRFKVEEFKGDKMPSEEKRELDQQFEEQIQSMPTDDKIVLLLAMCSDEEIIQYVIKARALRPNLPKELQPHAD